VATVKYLKSRAGFSVGDSLEILGIPRATYFRWSKTGGKQARINRVVPKSHWLLPSEREAIIEYKRAHPEIGYRRLAYMMLDEGVVATTPSSVYRVLREAGLTSKWTSAGSASRQGFVQPEKPHEQWHTDIAYLNILGTHYFFIGVLDGYSRYIVHHEVRKDMSTMDVQVVIERALAKLPKGSKRPRIITDNGGPYVALEFKRYLREKDISHTRTRARHPQSNGKIERFHKSLKEECVRREAMGSLEEARELIGRYVADYNHHRLHAALNYLRPVDYLKGAKHVSLLLAERARKLEVAREHRRKVWREVA